MKIKRGCPNCHGEITDHELLTYGVCEQCKRKGQWANEYASFHKLKRAVVDMENVFKTLIDHPPKALQRHWMKRLLMGESFSINAPPGLGKTSFGVAAALYFANTGKRAYVVVGTQLLVDELYQRLTDKGVDVCRYHSQLPHKEKQSFWQCAERSSIVITTAQFLIKHASRLKHLNFDFVFVDDVDAVLRTKTTFHAFLSVLGFDKKAVKSVIELLKCKAKGEGNCEKHFQYNNHTVCPQTVISSATLKVHPLARKILYHLLQFEVRDSSVKLRNVDDYYVSKDVDVVELIKTLGSGTLVLVSVDKQQHMTHLKQLLTKQGLKVFTYKEMDEQVLRQFEQRKVDVLIGLAHPHNALVRGIDLKNSVKHVVFYGVPKRIIPLTNLTTQAKTVLLSHFHSLPQHIKQHVMKCLKKKENRCFAQVLNALKGTTWWATNVRDGVISVADFTTYIQGTGRCSRLTAHGLTKGAAITVVDDPSAFAQLQWKLKVKYDQVFTPLTLSDVERVKKNVEAQRNNIKKTLKTWESVLVIVESPTKARTISTFFGTPVKRKVGPLTVYDTLGEDAYYTLVATTGHLLDLVTQGGIHGVEINHNYQPIYDTIKRCKYGSEIKEVVDNTEGCEQLNDKFEIVKALRRLAMESDKVIVATDPDTEGEKIAYDVYTLLKPFNIPIKRAEYHEVTPKAVRNAFQQLKDFNVCAVKAQITRRVSDRWVGFVFSQYLQQQLKHKNVSAGRVQTPVLRWVIERAEDKRKKSVVFIEAKQWRVQLTTSQPPPKLSHIHVSVNNTTTKTLSPLPPFTTATLLKDASARLKLSANAVMRSAQQLFEAGLITYHRTSSTHVSDKGKEVATTYIAEHFGTQYLHTRTWGEEGAHECIRPTKPYDVNNVKLMMAYGWLSKLDQHTLQLYDLIFRRFMSSQMKAVRVQYADVTFKVKGWQHTEHLALDVLDPTPYPPVLTQTIKPGEYDVKVHRKKVREVPLFTQGSLVEEMQRKGLGRPSTYATIIHTLLKRKYVIERGPYLIPTSKARVVMRLLTHTFPDITTETFTAQLEKEIDEVEAHCDHTPALTNLLQRLKPWL